MLFLNGFLVDSEQLDFVVLKTVSTRVKWQPLCCRPRFMKLETESGRIERVLFGALGPSDGVVLIYHKKRKFVPYIIIEALKKNVLLDRFTTAVTGNW